MSSLLHQAFMKMWFRSDLSILIDVFHGFYRPAKADVRIVPLNGAWSLQYSLPAFLHSWLIFPCYWEVLKQHYLIIVLITEKQNPSFTVNICFDKTEGVSCITDQRWIARRSTTITSGPSGFPGTRSWFTWTAALCRGRSKLFCVWYRPVP